jgi:hypothetical protein
MTGRPTTNHQLAWKIDGSAANGIISGEGINVNWHPYGGGYHLLQLTVKWTDSSGELAGSCSCDMNVLVVRVPDATIVLI